MPGLSSSRANGTHVDLTVFRLSDLIDLVSVVYVNTIKVP